jgi:CPA2 family monovalent cation:H+ antiporter-2
VVATPDPYQAREIVRLARQANPKVDIVVRTHNATEERYLEALEVGRAIMGERELALGMAHYALVALGRSDDDADAAIARLRESAGIAAKVR